MPGGKERDRGKTEPKGQTVEKSEPGRRHRQVTLQSSLNSLRRSKRVTEAYCNHKPTEIPNTDPMTDVARRTHCTQLNTRSNDANISRQRTRPRPGRSAGEPHGFNLDFVVRPPNEVRVGSSISPAVTLQVRTVRRGSSAALSNQNLHHYFVVVSLLQLHDDGDVDHASPGVLSGRQLADTIHAQDHATLALNSPDILGYVSFPNLVIRSQGTYRLRISLMRVASSGGSKFLHSEDSGLILAS
ncbi:hypothetical protein FKW77_003439 [Venturia effusa]|uniref:Velvet domain-containing protein n=1 Tax=Venturia effusa TaxID=50376 RepID=A0A517L121_9PEZI|nr:hypothetical protein FKW77_003439 [Venturia effusa]